MMNGENRMKKEMQTSSCRQLLRRFRILNFEFVGVGGESVVQFRICGWR